ncbi:MAG: hydrogenase formation protein HypD [Anaerolineaceae bacterium]|nr:hydrogenase formation protein HypD [Anaerolineaceae bacterium]
MTSPVPLDRRSPTLTLKLIEEIRSATTRPWNIMEICGGQTHAILQYGLDQLLPESLRLIHGPGCPVCVTSLESIENALALAAKPGVILTSFGDMLRVPGASSDLLTARSKGADIRVVYSPLEAARLARANPSKEVVFFAIGFETTVPTIAASILHARRNKINNFSILPANVRVPPAMEAILGAEKRLVHAFLAAGHVCAVMGYHEYLPLAEKYRCPIVVTGFEPLDIACGILMAVKQLEEGRAEVENAYGRAVSQAGNLTAQAMIEEVFEPIDRKWRGIGEIPLSGHGLRADYAQFDALERFRLEAVSLPEPSQCQAGQVLRGLIEPPQCPAFGKACTPTSPLGAPMVSSEGACAAYYRYHRVF